jgi:hypothetical protein
MEVRNEKAKCDYFNTNSIFKYKKANTYKIEFMYETF